MKPILIQGAMDIEIEILIKKLSTISDKVIGGYEFYKGFLNGCPIIISKTNIGMTNSACATTIGILEYNPSIIINQGTAGAYGKINVGDIIIGKSAVNINTFEKPFCEKGIDFKSWIHTDFSDHDGQETKKILADEKLVNIFASAIYKTGKIHKGIIGSGDVWNKESDFIKFLQTKLKVNCEDMETASVYKVCNNFNIPVIGIRVASNNEVLKQAYNRETANYCQELILSKIHELLPLF